MTTIMNTMHATCTSRGVHILLCYENPWCYELFTNKESTVYSGATALKLAYLWFQVRYRQEELKAILWLRLFLWCQASSRSRTAVEVSLFGPHLFDTLAPVSSCHFPTPPHSPTHSHSHTHISTHFGILSTELCLLFQNERNERFVLFISPTKQPGKYFFFSFLLYYFCCIWLKAGTTWIKTQTTSVYFSNINITTKNTISCPV